MKLLGKASSINVRKVLWICTELGLDIEREDWGSGFRSTHSPAFLRLNPNAMVPVLIDGDFVLWESNAICRYLAAQAGREDLLPSAARERARVEQWMDWQATELNNAWRYAFSALVRHSPAHADPAQITASLASWARHLEILDQQLARTGAWAAGTQFTLADVVLALSVNRWNMTPVEAKPAFEHLERYMQRLAGRAGFALHCANGMA